MTRISVSERIVEKRSREIRMTLEKGATLRIACEVLGIALPYEEVRRIVAQKYPDMLKKAGMVNRSGRRRARIGGSPEGKARRTDPERQETHKDL